MEPRKTALIGLLEKAERAHPDTEAWAEFAAKAVTRDVVGEWLLTLAQSDGMGA
jgi:hypothetical protein